jgi:hypothetical protein
MIFCLRHEFEQINIKVLGNERRTASSGRETGNLGKRALAVLSNINLIRTTGTKCNCVVNVARIQVTLMTYWTPSPSSHRGLHRIRLIILQFNRAMCSTDKAFLHYRISYLLGCGAM